MTHRHPSSRPARSRATLVTPAALALCTCLALPPPALAYNRNDVFAELDRVPDDWIGNEASVHIGDDEDDPDPGVLIGDAVTLTVRASRPAHFTIVMVDSKGELAVIAPTPSSVGGPASGVVYPPPGTGDLVQGEPVGMQTVYLFATERAVPPAALGIAAGDDFAVPGRDPIAVAALVDVLSDTALTGRRAVDRYRYLVDADVELGTRAVRRELNMLAAVDCSRNSAPAPCAARSTCACSRSTCSTSAREIPRPEACPAAPRRWRASHWP